MEVRELQGLVRRLEALVEIRVAEENRLEAGSVVAAVRSSVEVHIAYLSAEIKRTEALIRHQIDNHSTLKEQSELLDSIPGIGRTTAALLLAEIVDITQYESARQVAAYAGLVPRERGKCKMSVIGAAMRKLIHLAYGVLKTGKPFDPECAKSA
jgi:transposase